MVSFVVDAVEYEERKDGLKHQYSLGRVIASTFVRVNRGLLEQKKQLTNSVMKLNYQRKHNLFALPEVSLNIEMK
jgi:hypothetical protein